MLYSNDIAHDLALVCPKAWEFLIANPNPERGRHELGDGDFANVNAYDTKTRDQGVYEAHRDYVDIQCVLEGAEVMEVAPVDEVEQTQDYDAGDDYALYDGTHAGEGYLMTPGRFCMVMPADAHMPGLAPDGHPAPVRKVVFKVKVGNLAHYAYLGGE